MSLLPKIASGYGRHCLRQDAMASLVVFLVALPLCMGVAIASGAPAASGLVTGIVGGVLVGLLAGCPLQVSGPTVSLAVIVWAIVQEYGLAMLGPVVIMAGLFQLAAGALSFGRWFRVISPAVISGLLSGIGVLILAGQFHVMLDDQPKGTGLANLLSIPAAVWQCLSADGIHSGHIAGVVGLFTIALMVCWETLVPKRFRAVPAALVAVVSASLLAFALDLDIRTVTLPENLWSAITLPTPQSLRQSFQWKLVLEAAALAFVASAETLLTALTVDKLRPGLKTRYDRELISQGFGNMVCGFLGALPMAGVIVRSSVNVQAGAQTRASTVLHGWWLLLSLCFVPFLLRLIPTSCLAALLVYTGYKLINLRAISSLGKYGKSEVAIYLATLAAIVATDLLTGVIVGVILSIIKLLYIFSHLETSISGQLPGALTLHLHGSATFLSLPTLSAALDSVPPGAELHVRLEDLDYIDHACLDLLMTWELHHKATGGEMVIDWSTLGIMFRDRRRRGTRAAQPPQGHHSDQCSGSRAGALPPTR